MNEEETKDNPALVEQKLPKGRGVDVCTLVKQDLEDRITLGEKRYGERLKTFNGRDAVTDAYQEVLDLSVYLRQYIEEQRVKSKNEDEVLNLAWGLIANAGGGNWSVETDEWQKAARRWQELYNKSITWR
jgi:hypothetical protein